MTVDPSTTEEGYLAGVGDNAGQGASSQDAKPSDATSGADDQGAKEPISLMDAVKARLEEDAAGDSPAPKDEGGEEKSEPEAKEGEEPAKAEGEDEGAEEEPPFHKHPAWQRQVAKRKEAEARVSELAPKAERFDQMQTMMRNAELSLEEVSAGFNIMALMKGDPAKALEALQPYYQSLLLATGHALPSDLQQRVAEGRLSEDDARELARTRTEREAANRKAESAQRRFEEGDRRAQVNDIAAGVSEWEASWQARDPDYARKLPFVEAQIKAMRMETPPRTRAEAVQMAKDALKVVEDNMKPFAPRRPEIKAPPDGSSATAVPAPRNSFEAAEAALRNLKVA